MHKFIRRCVLRLQNLSYRKKLVLTSFTVSIIPLMITTVFCYYQIVSNLYEKETTALEYTLNTASDSLNHQLELYENLITHITSSDTVITTASRKYESIYEKYEQFTYSYDVFLTSVYNQHPDVEQVTLYTRQEDLSHGLQLRPLSELPQQTWFTGSLDTIQAEPQWYVDTDGTMVVLAKVPEPYAKIYQGLF